MNDETEYWEELFEIDILEDEIENLYYYLELEEESDKIEKILEEIKILEEKLNILLHDL